MPTPSGCHRSARQFVGRGAVERQAVPEHPHGAIRLADQADVHGAHAWGNLDIERGNAPPARTWADLKYFHVEVSLGLNASLLGCSESSLAVATSFSKTTLCDALEISDASTFNNALISIDCAPALGSAKAKHLKLLMNLPF
jgi:hypothetical protein